jgi:hypothetical protein
MFHVKHFGGRSYAARPTGRPQTPVAKRRNGIEDARPEGRAQFKAV